MSKKVRPMEESWEPGTSKNITFIVTKDCQLACKYCYLVGKNAKERMSFEIAKKSIDYIFENRSLFNERSVEFDFIGGEPLMEVDLIDRICDYIKRRLFEINHPWFNAYRFCFATNGLLFSSDAVQRFVKKNHSHLSIEITIDGTKEKHDLNRVYKSGRGSYDDVVANIPLWLEQFPNCGTKVTISHADLPFVHESVIHLFDLGIKVVNINVVFEAVWEEGDDKIFENQLLALADEIIDKNYYEDCVCSFFVENIGRPLDPILDNGNWCGSGNMLAIDAAGTFYPCTRFAQYSLREKGSINVGNCFDGVNTNLLRPFLSLDRTTQSPQECIECEVASGCAWCQGENYDAADTDTIYQRSTAICKMHKARVKANNYYWNKLFHKLEQEGKQEEFESYKKTSIQEPC